MIAVPVGAACQRAVVAQQNNLRGAKVDRQLNGALPGVKGVIIRCPEQVNAVAQVRPAADRPALSRGFQRAVVFIPPAAVGGKKVLAVGYQPDARVNGDDGISGSDRFFAVGAGQRRSAGYADK